MLVGCGGAANGPALQDTQWVLATLEGEPPLPGTAPSAEFSADEISGSGGCNTYFGAYAVGGSEITIGDVASTEMWCMEPEGVTDQEQAFLADLSSAAGYRSTGAQLELLDAAERVILTFDPRPASPWWVNSVADACFSLCGAPYVWSVKARNSAFSCGSRGQGA